MSFSDPSLITMEAYSIVLKQSLIVIAHMKRAAIVQFCHHLRTVSGTAINSAENSPASTCYTHIQGLKCEMNIDMDSKYVKVLGV